MNRFTSTSINSKAKAIRFTNTFAVKKIYRKHGLKSSDKGIDTYFADPYKSIQRTRNENTNGLIHHEENCPAKPKSSSFDGLSHEQIKQIEDALNNRPRKFLDWLTPNEVMASFYTVALSAWIRQIYLAIKIYLS